ncbi:MAG: universal stress protein [Rhodobacter sp.]|nr:universal stress protein [Rhodobacter sp.]
MYKNILVPIALEHERDTGSAMDIAHRLLAEGGKITALHVMEAIPGYATQYLPEGHMESRHTEMQAALKAELGGVKDVKPVVITGHAGRSIVEFAEDNDIDCIVIASHQPGLQDYLLGSTAARVVRHATCAVHVIR